MASSRFDPQAPDKSSRGSAAVAASSEPVPETDVGQSEIPEIDFLGLMGVAERLSRDYQGRTIERQLSRSYRAWQNQHAEGSKYLGTAWKGRSRLFVPKTRVAVRKNLAAFAAALFSNEDVVNVAAEYDDNDQARASAAVIKEVMDWRLTRHSVRSGLPWFQIAMGACLDSQLTGVVISKQFWEYVEVESGQHEAVLLPLIDPDTNEIVLDEVGQPVMVEGLAPIMTAVRDRPMIELVPIENCGVDPAAPWYAPAQLGRWWYVDYGMGISDVKAMIASGAKDGIDTAWLPNITDELLLKGRVQDDRTASRRVREGGADRYEDAKGTGDLDIVWIRENFLRISGVDYHFWSVGRHGYLSEVRRTAEVYPEFKGDRPYAFGVAQLDTHRVFPMSPVESWQPLQLELNDITNLRQDTLKRAIAPLTIVKRGQNVDLGAVQKRGQPDAMVLVNSIEDVKFEATPGPNGAAYTETSINNAMFDELAGAFSTSSVQSSRQLNETVGGMRLMSGAANAVTEFDLRMLVETWVEPALRQIAHLIAYHESDERILALAGEKAKVAEKYNYLPNLSDFEQVEIALKVNVGIGSLDPMQKLAKLRMSMEMLAPTMPEAKAQGITLNMEALIDEVMGAAGYRDGKRFFTFGEPQAPPQDPKIALAMEEMKVEREALQAKLQQVILELKSEENRNTQDNQTAIQVEAMRGRREVVKQVVGAAVGREARQHSADMAREDRDHASTMKAEDSRASRRQRIAEILARGPAQGQKPAQDQGGSLTPEQLSHIMMGLGEPEDAAQAPPEHGNLPVSMGPDQGDMAEHQGGPDQMMRAMGMIAQQLDAMNQRSAIVERGLQSIIAHLTAPTEVVRDPETGMAVGVRKGGKLHQIVRGADNRVEGMAPVSLGGTGLAGNFLTGG
jgi:hypothetical protein